MFDETVEVKPEVLERKRNFVVAGLMSLFIPGLGQFYNGKIKRAAAIVALEFALITLAHLILFARLEGLIASIFILVLFRIAFMFDAARQARKINVMTLKKSNRLYYYALYAVCVLLLTKGVLFLFAEFGVYRSFVVPTTSMANTLQAGDQLIAEMCFDKNNLPKRGEIIFFIYPGDRDEVKATEKQFYLKRCVALPGDTVVIKDKKLYINGRLVKEKSTIRHDPSTTLSSYEKYLSFPPGLGFTSDNYGPLRVPAKGDIIHLSNKNIPQWKTFIGREGHELSASPLDQVLVDGKPADTYRVQKNYVFCLGDNRGHSLDSRHFGFIADDLIAGKPLYLYSSVDPDYNYMPLE